jgi:hypothetical protein
MTKFLNLIRSVSEHILAKKLFKPNQFLLVTISGGQDSVCLFLILLHLKNQWKWKMQIIYCNHLWQIDSFFIIKQLVKFIKLFSISFSIITTTTTIFSEKEARTWRYFVFYRLAIFVQPPFFENLNLSRFKTLKKKIDFTTYSKDSQDTKEPAPPTPSVRPAPPTPSVRPATLSSMYLEHKKWYFLAQTSANQKHLGIAHFVGHGVAGSLELVGTEFQLILKSRLRRGTTFQLSNPVSKNEPSSATEEYLFSAALNPFDLRRCDYQKETLSRQEYACLNKCFSLTNDRNVYKLILVFTVSQISNKKTTIVRVLGKGFFIYSTKTLRSFLYRGKIFKVNKIFQYPVFSLFCFSTNPLEPATPIPSGRKFLMSLDGQNPNNCYSKQRKEKLTIKNDTNSKEPATPCCPGPPSACYQASTTPYPIDRGGYAVIGQVCSVGSTSRHQKIQKKTSTSRRDRQSRLSRRERQSRPYRRGRRSRLLRVCRVFLARRSRPFWVSPFYKRKISFVIGHSANDKVETLLFNLIRGSGLNGIFSLRWKRYLQNNKFKKIVLKETSLFQFHSGFFIMNHQLQNFYILSVLSVRKKVLYRVET